MSKLSQTYLNKLIKYNQERRKNREMIYDMQLHNARLQDLIYELSEDLDE